MHHVRLVCGACGAGHAPDMKTLECSDCDGPLDAEYTGPGTSLDVAGYNAAMPFSDAASMPTLGEGDTPVVGLMELGGALGLDRLDAKLEYMNPTGSYKDRGTVVMLAVARELGVGEVVEDSSGNAGASVSAYSARAGIKAHIFAPATAPAAKLRQIRVYGAEVHSIEGPREAATEAAVAFCDERDLVYASHAWSPFFFEGTKTFAFETAGQYGGEPPAHIVFPVGNGGLFLGAWRGFNELLDGGHIDRIPRLHAVQAANVMPIAAGFMGRAWDKAGMQPTMAGGISVAAPARGAQVVDVIRRANGAAVAVDEEEISAMQRALARDEGIFAEPTSAAAFAGVRRLMEDGVVAPGESVLVPVTGSGLKDEVRFDPDQ